MAKMYNKDWNRNNSKVNNNAEECIDDFVLESPIDNTIKSNDLEFIFEGTIDNDITSINRNNKSVYINGEQRNSKSVNQNKSTSVSTEDPADISTIDITKAISKVSNMIRDSLKNNADIYVAVRHGNIQANDFYIKLGNSIWQSLLELFNITRNEAQDPNFVFQLDVNQKYIKTLQFLDRIYHDTRVSLVKDPIEAISNYNEVFGEDGGINSDWLDYLGEKIDNKMNFLNPEDIDVILNSITAFSWCYTDSDDARRFESDKSCGCDDDCCGNDTCDCTDNHEYDDDDDDDEYYDDDMMDDVLYVDFNNDEDVDDTIVTITTCCGLSTTLYADLDNIDVSNITGRPMQWLKHFVPNAVVITEEVELFESLNDEIDEIKLIRLADVCDITDQKDDKSVIIGIYNIDGDLIDMSDIELQKLNILVETNMNAAPAFSHLQRTLEMEDLIIDEDTIIEQLSSIVDIIDEDDDGDDDGDDEETTEDTCECIEESVGFDTDQDILDYAASLISDDMIPSEIPGIVEEVYEDEGEDLEFYEEELNEDGITIGDYLTDKHIDVEEVVFAPIRKNKDSKYNDIQ